MPCPLPSPRHVLGLLQGRVPSAPLGRLSGPLLLCCSPAPRLVPQLPLHWTRLSTRLEAGEQVPHRRRRHLMLLTYRRARDRGPDAGRLLRDARCRCGCGAVCVCVCDGASLSPREWNAIPKSPVSSGPTPNSRRLHVTPTSSFTDMLCHYIAHPGDEVSALRHGSSI